MTIREWASVITAAVLLCGACYVMLVAVLSLPLAGVGVYGG